MRTLSAMVAALSLGACAARPPTLTDIVAQIRSDLRAGEQSCAGRGSTDQIQTAQANCFHPNPVAQSKPSVQTAETLTKQRIINVHPPGFNTAGPVPPPKLAGANETVVEGVPALNSDASCHLPDNLAVGQNVNRCLAVESSARDQLDRKWTEFPSADRSHCIRYSSASGGYADLLTCLEMELYAKNLHAKNRSVANQ
jgi:hypothetical protein